MSGANLLEPANVASVVGFCRKQEADPSSVDAVDTGKNGLIACGIFLIVLAIYALSNPGRIDITDGEARFDVAHNWLVTGRPIMRDRWIAPFMSVPGRGELRYSYYGAPASVFSMPLVWLGLHTSGPAIQRSQFLFSFTSSIIGAGIAPVLFLFYLELGLIQRKAFAWTMVSSFATLVWPSSNTTFDNAQHAFFALAAAYFGFLSARRRSLGFAVLGGLMGGILVLYQGYFLLIIPALALLTVEGEVGEGSENLAPGTKSEAILSRIAFSANRAVRGVMAFIDAAWQGKGETRSSCVRCCVFLAGVGLGLIVSFAYNHLRFGAWLDDGKVRAITASTYPLFGNPMAGLLTLLISPGKSILLYSPTLIFGFLGIGYFWRQHRKIAQAVVLSTIALVSFLSCIDFAAGDWCWGPRYLTILLPLWALAFPFIPVKRLSQHTVLAIVGVSFLVQAMSLTVETQRFFFERGFKDYFWVEDKWVYFKHSALFARVGETLTLADGPPSTARFFSSAPATEGCTYTILGPPPQWPRSISPIWMRNFKIYYLPRPWPLWMSYLPPALRPVRIGDWLLGLFGLTVLGAGLIHRGFQQGSER